MKSEKYKYGIIVANPLLWSEELDSKNIGDYIQTVAAKQYLDRVDYLIDRECVTDFSSDANEPVKVIMNSWWMWHPENWPPSKDIIPLPLSIHISPIASNKMLSGEGLKWFKKFEPIGARDIATLKLLNDHCIKSFFSSCLTLTLCKTYKPIPQDQRQGVCFVDPYIIKSVTRREQLKALLRAISRPFVTFKLCKCDFFWKPNNNTPPINNKSFKRLIKAMILTADFYYQYSTKFAKQLLLNSEYMTHVKWVQKGIDNDESLISDAENLIREYQHKKLVITSRIHAALPCLSMETPLIYIFNQGVVGENWNANRLDGLIDLFRSMQVTRNGLYTDDEVLKTADKITDNITFSNKLNWEVYANNLQNQCEEFVKECEYRG